MILRNFPNTCSKMASKTFHYRTYVPCNSPKINTFQNFRHYVVTSVNENKLKTLCEPQVELQFAFGVVKSALNTSKSFSCQCLVVVLQLYEQESPKEDILTCFKQFYYKFCLFSPYLTAKKYCKFCESTRRLSNSVLKNYT